MALSFLRVAWDEPTPEPDEEFVRYSIYRRIAGTTSWTKVGEVTPIGTTQFDDYNVAWERSYEYAVTWAANIGGAVIESPRQTFAGSLDSDDAKRASPSPSRREATLHVVDDPETYVQLTQQSVNVREELDVAFLRAWSRAEPTPHVGTRQSATITINAAEFWNSNREMWDSLVEVLQAQRDLGSVLCLRHREELYFVAVDNGSRSDRRPVQYDMAVSLREVHYDESVE